jgi:hypothetical protein
VNAHVYVPTPAAAAVAAQLSDEIQATGRSLHAIAGSLGRHYETMSRYARLERALSVDDLLTVLDVIGLN